MNHALINHRTNLSTLAAWAMFSRGLEPEFPVAALEQLASFKGAATGSGGGIRDLTDRDWCSIDNDDSRDLDQLSLSEPMPRGGLRVFVAVADVDALVKKGTPIDQHAQLNTTSVYTSARIFPMLPERLSTDLTSLNQGEDRLAIVSEMAFTDDGVLVESTIYRALVHNKAQLAYDAVSDWIDGKGELPEAARAVHGLDTQLRAQDGLAQKLRVLRRAEGSLEFETFQPRAQFDGERIIDIRQQVQNRARQLIEELMIATNGCTARYLASNGGLALRRVVRSPERWLRIVDVAKAYGVKLPNQPDGKALEAFLARQHREDPLRFPDLSLVIVKLMGSGEYVVERSDETPIGHFGLAVQDYMHSTAPNRRFPDLITQRLVKAALAGVKTPYSPAELVDIATHCTAQEDASRKVERQMRKSEAALLLHSRVGQRFAGLVTGVSDHGVWVRIFEPPVEGRLTGDLPELRVGRSVRVRLVSTSVERGFIDFALEH
ncbi:ribonuclease II [Hydrogenophaga crassostreae]|uniref:Ribonuclease II n=1 Tax=Hydrogenophaga crassostreae TaxID=1763535 RepID=A0A162SXJ3_9BURK|nr:RNB domain-containing ribonuclease [Hydrogenophaga crassostreae]AOW14970.1 ribonuclease II [Hydrogenophaga crassostreae]OAD41422.1 ribonuclease II [Hydrogenophaga crassostreae]